MTIASKLTIINNALSDIKGSIIAKGSIPEGDITTFSAAIDNIGSGSVNNENVTITPTTSNQSFSPQSPYTGFGLVKVNAVTPSIDSNISAENIKKNVSILGVVGTYEGSEGPVPIGEVFKGDYNANGEYIMPYDLTYTGDIEFTGIKSVTTAGAFASYLYHQSNQPQRLRCRRIIGNVSFPDLETISGQYCFYSFCNGQTSITTVSFPKLTGASGSNCFNYAFQGCTSLTNLYFNSLVSANASTTCTAFSSYMLSGVSNCTVHFPSNLQSTIGNNSFVKSKFGGSRNTSVVFDLDPTS